MTIIFNRGTEALTVFPEAVRALRHQNGQWLLFVSDPELMSVSKFKLSKETIKQAADETKHVDGIRIEDSEWLLTWLLGSTITADQVGADGLPAMSGLGKFARPVTMKQIQKIS
jgi:hypothetical protein